jgi:hypothetical protein
VVGDVGDDQAAGSPPSKLMWLIRLEGERMAEMWMYRQADHPARGK